MAIQFFQTANFANSVTATSFVKSGGTSSQYLMADGSVSTGSSSVAWADITSKPTTISGFGITDAFSGSYADLTNVPSTFAPSAHNHDGTYLKLSGGGNLSGGVININTNTNTNTLNVSRGGSNSSQVMKVGVTDTVAVFNYIEDTTSEGNGNFGQYQFKLGGNDGETTVTGFTITKTGVSAPNLSGTNTGDQDLSGYALSSDVFSGDYNDLSNKPSIPTDFVSAANGGTFSDSINVHGNILLTGTATTTNQSRTIDFTGFDKEGTTDSTDRAFIRHTTNTGGHSGSVLQISSMNDSGDGIAFTTHASSLLKHNGNAIFSEGHKPTWSEIESKPSTFAPSAHNHAASNITSGTLATARLDSSVLFGNNSSGTNEGNFNNWNDLSKTGFYSHSGATGRWSGASNWSSVMHFKLYDDNNHYASQLGFDTYNADFFYRMKNNGTWTDWYEVYHEGHKPTWSEIDSKPSTFPPSSHNHDGTYVKIGATHSLGSVTRFQSNNEIDTASGSQSPLEIYQDNAGHDAFMTFHISGDYAAYFGLDGASNDFVFGGWSKGAVKQRIFHEGHKPTWSEIESKPSTFAPSSHNHSASEITSGTFSTSRIPNLGAGKITSGTFAAARIAHNSFDIGDTTAETGRSVHETGIYTFNRNNGTLGTGTESAYYSVLAWGQGTGGSAQIAAKWTGGGDKLYYRSLRDTTDNWWDWKEIYHTGHKPTASEIGAASSSHNHDSTYVNVTGDTMTGQLTTTKIATNHNATQAAPRYDTSFYVAQSQHYYGQNGTQGMYLGESGNDVYIRGQVAIGGTAIQSGYGLTMTGHVDLNNHSIDYVNQLHFQAGVRFYDDNNDNYLNFKWNDYADGGIRFRNGNGTVMGTVYGDGTDQFGLLDADGSWAVRIDKDTCVDLRVNNSTRILCDTGGTEFRNGGTTVGEVTTGGLARFASDVVAYYGSFSDRRLKTNIKPTTNNLDKILKLEPVEYTWKDGGREGEKEIGLIAQDVEKVVPEVVRENQRLNDDTLYKQVDYEHLVSTLIGAIQEQQDQIAELKSEVTNLKSTMCKCKN